MVVQLLTPALRRQRKEVGEIRVRLGYTVKPSQNRWSSGLLAERSLVHSRPWAQSSIPQKKENLKLCLIKSTMPVAAFHLWEIDSTLKGILAAEEGQDMANLDVLSKSS